MKIGEASARRTARLWMQYRDTEGKKLSKYVMLPPTIKSLQFQLGVPESSGDKTNPLSFGSQ
jgi:hypothetical protein